jgi:hypothetical protein
VSRSRGDQLLAPILLDWLVCLFRGYLKSCRDCKVKVSCPFSLPSTTPWRRMGEWRYSSTYSLTAALDGVWLASRHGRSNQRKRAPGTHLIGGWVGPMHNGIKYMIWNETVANYYKKLLLHVLGESWGTRNASPTPGFESGTLRFLYNVKFKIYYTRIKTCFFSLFFFEAKVM